MEYFENNVAGDMDKIVINNSCLSYINPLEGGHPTKFWKHFNGGLDAVKSDAMSFGTLFHQYCENPSNFPVEYVKKVDGKMGVFIETVDAYENSVEKFDVSEIYKYAYSKAEFAIKLDKVIENFGLEDNQNYYNYLKESRGKYCISKVDKDLLDNLKLSLESHPKSALLLGKSFGYEVYTEQEIYFKYNNFSCKAKLDRIVIDYDNKIIKEIDFKTYSSGYFPESFVKYNYDRQRAFYKLALQTFALEKGIPHFKIESYIVACSKSTPFTVYLYLVSDPFLMQGAEKVHDLMQIIQDQIFCNNWKYWKAELNNDYTLYLDHKY